MVHEWAGFAAVDVFVCMVAPVWHRSEVRSQRSVRFEIWRRVRHAAMTSEVRGNADSHTSLRVPALFGSSLMPGLC